MNTPLFRPEAVAHRYDAALGVALERRPGRIGLALGGALMVLAALLAWLALYEVAPGRSLLSWMAAPVGTRSQSQ